MKSSLYSTTAGMLTSAERLNTIANNLANISTMGFKSDIPFEQTLKFLDNQPYPGKDQPVMGGQVVDMAAGVIKDTGRNLDLAIEGPGFFAVQGPNNETLYTRNGSFSINSNRELVTGDGFKILDKFDKPIVLFGNDVQFSGAGDVIIDNAYITTLKIMDIPDRNNIEKVGTNFFKPKNNATPVEVTTPSLATGALELSNANVMESMTDMIVIQRAFDIQKTAADLVLRLLRKSMTDVAKPI